MSLPDAKEIRQLLGYLPVEPQFAVSLETLQDIRQRNSEKPLPASHTETIEELRRIVYRSKDFQQTGLFEFHLSLLFMEGSRYNEAAGQFALARRQWEFIDDSSLDCLAHFGEGLARHHNQEFEEAVDHYLKVQQFIDRTEDGSLPALWVEDDDDLAKFINQTKKELESATESLKDNMRDAYQVRLTHVAEVEPPIINERMKKNGPTTKVKGDLLLAFELGESLTLIYFNEIVLPTLDAIGRINNALISIEGAGITPPVTIKRITFAQNLEILLGDCLPDTITFCLDLYGDDLFRYEHEAKVIELEAAINQSRLNSVGFHSLATTSIGGEKQKDVEAEIRKKKNELRSLELQQAQKQIDTYVSGKVSAEKRAATAVIVLPAVRSLLGSLSGGNLSIQ